VADPQRLEGRVDPLVHRGTGDAEVLQSEGELLANRQLRARELVRRRGEDDSHLAEEVADRRLGSRAAGNGDASTDHRPHHSRDERGRRQC
jgi:hypothetical protein